MRKFKRTLASILVVLMLVSSFAFAAELPSNYLVIGDKAIDLSYAMNNKEAFNTILGEYLAGGGTVEGLYVAIAGAVQDAYGNDLTQEQQDTVVNQLMTLVNTENPDGTPLVTEVTLQTVTAANAENFVVTAALSGAPETTPVAEDFAVAITVDTVATALEGTFSYDTETNTATFTYPAIAKTDAEQTVNVEVTYKEGTAVAAEAITIPVNDDTTAPTITDAVVTNYQTLTVNFDEKVMGTATVTLNGTAVAAADVALAEDGMSLTLNKTAGYAAGSYVIVVNGLTDVVGNAMAENEQVIATKDASYVSAFTVTTEGVQAAASEKIYYTVKDQYGEDITSSLNGANTLDDNFAVTASLGELPLTLTAGETATTEFYTITETLVADAVLTVNFKNTVNSVEYTASKAFTVGAAVAAKASSVSEITGAASYTAGDDDVALTAVLLDQYGNPYTLAGGEKLRWTTSDAAIVMLDNDDNDATDGAFADGSAGQNTFNIDAVAPGTATIKVFLPGETTAAKSLDITVADGDLNSIDATNATISVVNNATVADANVVINDNTATKYVLFKNSNNSNIPVVASTVDVSVVIKGTTTDASSIVGVEKVADTNGYLTGLKVTTDRTEQDAAAVAGNPNKIYTVTLTSNTKTANFDVTSTIDTVVASMTDITFAANELTNGATVVKAVFFKNQYGEFVEVLDGTNGAGSSNVSWTSTAGLALEACKDDTGAVADATDDVTHIKFTASTAGAKTAAITAGSALKSVSVTVADSAALTSFELGATTATVITGDVVDTGDKTATDLVMLDDGSKTVILIPVTFKDQYGNKMTVNADQFDMKFTGAAPATQPVFALYGAIADNTAALIDGAGTAVTHIGVKAETGDVTQTVTLQMRNEADTADIGTSKTVSTTVKAARALESISVAPTTANTVINVAKTFTVEGVDQYGVAVNLDENHVYLDTLANVAISNKQANTDANKADFDLTASAAGAYTATIFYSTNDGNLEAGEKSTTVTLNADTLANSVDRIEIQPTVTVAGATTGAANTTYDASNYKVALDDDDDDQNITFTVKAFDASNNEVSLAQATDVSYSVTALTSTNITTADTTFAGNVLTVAGNTRAVVKDDKITVKATSLNGKVDTLVVTVDDIANAAAIAGQYYLATTATGTEAITTADVDKQATVHVVGLNQFGKAVDVDESGAVVSAVAEDDNTVIAHKETAAGIVVAGKKLGTTTLRVILNEGSQLTLATTVTVADEAVVGVTGITVTATGTDGNIANDTVTWTDSSAEETATVAYYVLFGKDTATVAQVEALFTTKAQLDALVTAKQAMKVASTTGNDGGTGITLGTALTKYAVDGAGAANSDALTATDAVEAFVITIDLAGNIDVQTAGGTIN